jgi:glycosyltransferase involved in cell wall biosynthesis
MKNTIDILLATYNGENFLKEQIDSLLNQTYQNWRLLIHDDGSKDNTLEIIKGYALEFSDKIVFIDDGIKTGGSKNNFAHLMSFAKAPYIMFCDQDDVWLENKIELTLNKMLESEQKNSNKPVLVHTDLKVVDSNLGIIANSMFEYQRLNDAHGKDIYKLAVENCITGCTVMINNNLLKLSLPIPKEAIMHDWWIGLVCLGNKGVVEFENRSTILYRQHSVNTIGAKKFNKLSYFRSPLEIKRVISSYKSLYSQYRKANIEISLIRYVLTKFILIIKK